MTMGLFLVVLSVGIFVALDVILESFLRRADMPPARDN
jgi:hypothetical protein